MPADQARQGKREKQACKKSLHQAVTRSCQRTLPGTVASTVYHGATTQYLIEIAPGVTITVLEQNLPRMRHEDRWDDGDRVELCWSPEPVVVLAD